MKLRIKARLRLCRMKSKKQWQVVKKDLQRRTRNILVSLDQTAYVLITLGHGNPDETLSSAAYRTARDNKILGKFFEPIIDQLFKWLGEDNHCRNSYLKEMKARNF